MSERKIAFISAHPADRYGVIDRICEAVEATGEYTALYNDPPSDRGEGLPAGVDVLIILASVKYFTWANSGYQSEYFAAVRDGVRVLPILIEAGPNTIDLVNMRLGKIQYIDATESLDFAMDALRAHLTAREREVDPSLPSVFISYRRGDREVLREIVKQIEGSEAGKRVNLWYDEVIAPGENYSQSIMRELCSCDLFVLLVTPRILEPGNYVHRVEYAEAKKRGKRIVALEVAKTDRSALGQMYGSLPRIFTQKQLGALASVLAELKRKDKK